MMMMMVNFTEQTVMDSVGKKLFLVNIVSLPGKCKLKVFLFQAKNVSKSSPKCNTL